MSLSHSDENPLELEFVYVGAEKPTAKKFKPIENFGEKDGQYNSPNPSKPAGGLWASPVMENGKSDWENWLEEEDPYEHITNREFFGLEKKSSERFYITPKKGCRILCADEPEKLEPYLKRNNGQVVVMHHVAMIDYEVLMKDYDAIYVPERCDDYSASFYLWSAKTLLIGNFDAFDVQTELEHSKQKSSTTDMTMQYMFATKFHR